MAAQFLRIEAFSTKEAYRVTAEANRDDGFCGHLEKPEPPKWLVGCAGDVKVAVDDYMDTLTYITYKGGKKEHSQATFRSQVFFRWSDKLARPG